MRLLGITHEKKLAELQSAGIPIKPNNMLQVSTIDNIIPFLHCKKKLTCRSAHIHFIFCIIYLYVCITYYVKFNKLYYIPR
jgi:hypothetical protein